LALPDGEAPDLAFYFLSAAFMQSEAKRAIQILQNLKRARKAWPSLKSQVLVVDGYVTSEVSAKLLDSFEQVIYYDPIRFESDLVRSLRWFTQRQEKELVRPVHADRENELLSMLNYELDQRRAHEKSLYTQVSDLRRAVTEKPSNWNGPGSFWIQRVFASAFGLRISYSLARYVGVFMLFTLVALVVTPLYLQVHAFFLLRGQTATLASLDREFGDLQSKADALKSQIPTMDPDTKSLASDLSALERCRELHPFRLDSELLPLNKEVDEFLSAAEFVQTTNSQLDDAQAKIKQSSIDISELEKDLEGRNPNLFSYHVESARSDLRDVEMSLGGIPPTIPEARAAYSKVSSFYENWAVSFSRNQSKLATLCPSATH
jgi:hypothetical protein